jgi:hypothetical protein
MAIIKQMEKSNETMISMQLIQLKNKLFEEDSEPVALGTKVTCSANSKNDNGKDKLIQYLINKGINMTRQDSS